MTDMQKNLSVIPSTETLNSTVKDCEGGLSEDSKSVDCKPDCEGCINCQGELESGKYEEDMMGLAFILASFSTEVWQLVLTQGVLFGAAASFPYILGVTVPLQWIRKRRGLALAVVYMGSGVGGMWVVSGEQEGLYGWISVNYLLDGFDKTKKSHGFLDMGGASTQIAFQPSIIQPQYRDNLARITLRSLNGEDHIYDVFVATFLGHGTNEARRRFVDRLKHIATNNHTTAVPSIDDPCLPSGLLLPTIDGSAVLRGGGRFSECVAATEPLLNLTSCIIEPCLLGGVSAPKIDFRVQRFIGEDSGIWKGLKDKQIGFVRDHGRN
ncbi:Golgi apyrase [Coemansia sp. RSA 1365]|nr:Golgi apyrase [Coemansia sp. RSA 1365]